LCEFRLGRRSLLLAALALCVLFAKFGSFQPRGPRFSTLRYDYGVNLLLSAPKDSILFAESDEDHFTLYYLQQALGKRPDVRMVPTFLLFEPWGVDGFARRFPELGLSGSSAYPQDPIGRMSAASAGIFLRNKDRTPITFTYFEGALHHYFLPNYPDLLYRRIGLLGALEAPPLRGLPAPGPGAMRTRNLQGTPSDDHISLKGILRVYRVLGLSAP
jgi:hypothetical protein